MLEYNIYIYTYIYFSRLNHRCAMQQVFAPTPVRVFEGHKSDVVDLSWSHSDFLCSASIDHTVMLWHPIRCANACCYPRLAKDLYASIKRI